MRADRVPLSHLLVVLDLALLVVLVIVPVILMSAHLYKAAAGANKVRVQTDHVDVTVPRDQIVPFAIRVVTISKAPIMIAINLPGVLLQALISLPSRTSPPSSWHPQALMLDTWRTLLFPFFALPFWWLVGCGLDAIVSKEHLHRSLFLVGTLLSGICLALAFGFRFDRSAAEWVGTDWFIRGLAGWTIAFAVLPIAWIMQSIRQRRAISVGT
jgi:hypothetical protein